MRYEVRVIGSGYVTAAGESVERVANELLLATNSAEEAKRVAEQEGPSHHYGTVIIDTVARTADWGDEVTSLRGVEIQ